ncbi:LolA-related protein [Roseomonas sp. CAU 1739]|uniref:LolA-related protein n=1 Tax=Roseomonas sp. CAU 1739 TaxID=3140364 RepID=UPI00325B3FCC
MIRRAALIALLLLPTAARAQDAMPQVMAALAANRDSRATFVEEKELPELDRPLTARGTLAWHAPDRLEKRTTEPFEERLLVEGDRMLLERPDRGVRQELALDTAPEIRPLVEAIRATHAGDAATLRTYFRIDFSGDPERWRMVLTPLSVRVLAAVQRITIEGEGGAVLMVETQGREGRSRMTVTPAR